MKLRTLFGGLLAALGFTLAACGGGGNPNYRVPVDSPLMTFQAPEKEELLGDDTGDLSQPVEEAPPEGDEAPPAAKPAPAPVPAAKPAPPVTPPPATKPR